MRPEKMHPISTYIGNIYLILSVYVTEFRKKYKFFATTSEQRKDEENIEYYLIFKISHCFYFAHNYLIDCGCYIVVRTH